MNSEEDNLIDSVELEELSAEVEVTPPDMYATVLLEEAVERGASDLYISDVAEGISVNFRQLGRIHHVRILAREYGRRLQNHFRALADVGIGDATHPADGRERIELPNNKILDLRLSSLPTIHGQDVAVRIFNTERGIIGLDGIGFLDPELQSVLQLLRNPSGLIVVTGPTGSGKSNSMYAFAHHLSDGTRKIHTLEDPVEYMLPGVVQTQVNRKAGLDFSALLRATLRNSPDVIMIGEVRDHATAEIAVRAANSGHLVITSVHSRSAASAIQILLAYDVNRHFLASCLTGIVAQRLVRRLCPLCRQETSESELPDPVDGLRSRIPDLPPTKWYRPKPQGCEKCHQMGFDRLTVVSEVLSANQELREAISDGATTSRLQRIAVDSGMLTLAESARMRMALGITTPEEVANVIDPKEINELLPAEEQEEQIRMLSQESA